MTHPRFDPRFLEVIYWGRGRGRGLKKVPGIAGAGAGAPVDLYLMDDILKGLPSRRRGFRPHYMHPHSTQAALVSKEPEPILNACSSGVQADTHPYNFTLIVFCLCFWSHYPDRRSDAVHINVSFCRVHKH